MQPSVTLSMKTAFLGREKQKKPAGTATTLGSWDIMDGMEEVAPVLTGPFEKRVSWSGGLHKCHGVAHVGGVKLQIARVVCSSS